MTPLALLVALLTEATVESPSIAALPADKRGPVDLAERFLDASTTARVRLHCAGELVTDAFSYQHPVEAARALLVALALALNADIGPHGLNVRWSRVGSGWALQTDQGAIVWTDGRQGKMRFWIERVAPLVFAETDELKAIVLACEDVHGENVRRAALRRSLTEVLA